jgi:hypothetical protein
MARPVSGKYGIDPRADGRSLPAARALGCKTDGRGAATVAASGAMAFVSPDFPVAPLSGAWVDAVAAGAGGGALPGRVAAARGGAAARSLPLGGSEAVTAAYPR